MDVWSLSVDDDEGKKLISVPEEPHCYRDVQFASKSERIMEIVWEKSGAVRHVCIFIQLSYLSEQIIRGDKLKR